RRGGMHERRAGRPAAVGDLVPPRELSDAEPPGDGDLVGVLHLEHRHAVEVLGLEPGVRECELDGLDCRVADRTSDVLGKRQMADADDGHPVLDAPEEVAVEDVRHGLRLARGRRVAQTGPRRDPRQRTGWPQRDLSPATHACRQPLAFPPSHALRYSSSACFGSRATPRPASAMRPRSSQAEGLPARQSRWARSASSLSYWRPTPRPWPYIACKFAQPCALPPSQALRSSSTARRSLRATPCPPFM